MRIQKRGMIQAIKEDLREKISGFFCLLVLFILCVIIPSKIYSLSNFQISNTVLVSILYLTIMLSHQGNVTESHEIPLHTH